MMQGAEYFLIGAILLLLSIIASKASSRIGIPSLLLFILIGVLAGSGGFDFVEFNNPVAMQYLCIVALIFILFSAGFDIQATISRPILWQGIGLSTFGVLITAFLVAVFAYFVVPLSFTHSMLLGAIVSSTDAAAVFTIMRSPKVLINKRLKFLLEFEAGSNDPMAIFLSLICVNYILTETLSGLDLALIFIAQLAVGLFVGYAAGKFIPFLFNKINLEFAGLYPVLNVGLILLTYGLATSLKGNGFLAVYIAGLLMGNAKFKQKEDLYKFHDGFVWLMQITMFLILGLQIFPSQIPSIFFVGICLSTFIIIIARPAAVFSILAFSPLSIREKSFVAWTGLRGAVPIILASFPVIFGVSHADVIFNIVFFVVISSVLIQGTLLPFVAKWLKVN